jgi:8-amino-7-oxononanoate synthase
MNLWLRERLECERERRQSQSLWRRPRATPPGAIDLGSNDYLGLSRHPQVLAGAQEAIARSGGGARSSRLLGGDHGEVRALEAELAGWKGGASTCALVFSSGYVANIGTVCALAARGDWVLCDKRNHASLVDATRLAEAGGARVRFYGSIGKLRALLERVRGDAEKPGVWIVSDTVYSMDGDVADVRALLRLARQYDAALILDDAHGTGVLGAHGRGAIEAAGVEDSDAAAVAVVTVGTLSKALGSQGGFVLAPPEIISWLVNAARPLIYSTGIAPGACGAARAALQVLAAEPERLAHLHEIARIFAAELRRAGFDCEYRGTPIMPVIAGSSETAVAWSERLLELGVWCPPVRPPTVAVGTARLRASLRADLSGDDLDRALRAFGRLERPQVLA